jgi:hypothetical protein
MNDLSHVVSRADVKDSVRVQNVSDKYIRIVSVRPRPINAYDLAAFAS